MDQSPPPSSRRFSRRSLLGWSAMGTLLAGAGIVATEERSGTSAASPRPPTIASKPLPGALSITKDLNPGPAWPTSPAIIAENAKPGDAWWVTSPQQAGDIEGYASHVSGTAGESVTLFVSTKAQSYHVEAYRMGYYRGVGARLVWTSPVLPGSRQASPTLISATNTIECNWEPSLTFPIDDTWVPGAYLLKLVGDSGEQQFVPFCVRDDGSHAAVVIQHSVTTWQAYNRWGGYSLYYGNPGGELTYTHNPGNGSFADRARIVSFDRPYDHNWASGAADFVGDELPLIFHAERLGLDVTYWTDVDFHARPDLLTSHKALLSLGHDEYWSAEMRSGALEALAGGVNFGFLGANACYRQIRFAPSVNGQNRQVICYKSATEDPLAVTQPELTTIDWYQAPVNLPEAALIGSTYQDVLAHADMTIADATSWVLAGTGLETGDTLPGMILGEFDRFDPEGGGPINVDIVAHSLVANRGGNYSDVTWYTAPQGGGVFATGNASWVGQMADAPLIPDNVLPGAVPGVTSTLLTMMENVYTVLGSGPAGATHPSVGNWQTVYGAASGGAAPENDSAA